MLRIDCPNCGMRDHHEFSYRGSAEEKFPGVTPGVQAWVDRVFFRDNPKGVHSEYWQHTGGCRQWLVVERHTMTHEIVSVSSADKVEGSPGNDD